MSARLLAILAIISCFAPAVRGAEPAYADRPLSQWVADLSEKDPLIREEAIEVLIKIGPDARIALPKLAEMQERDTSVQVRRRAAIALWRIDGQTKPARDLLTAELKAPLPVTRLKAVVLLRELSVSGRELAPIVLESLSDADGAVGSLAAELLQQTGEDAVPGVVAALPKATVAKRQTLVSFLQGLGPHCQPAVSALRQLLKDKDPHARLAAARALLATDGDDALAIAEIQKLLKSTDGGVKLEAENVAFNLPHKS